MAEDNPFAKYAQPSAASPVPSGGEDNPFATYVPATPESSAPMRRPPLQVTVHPLPLTQEPETPQSDIGVGGAAGLGAIQGATFNFGDELAGLGAAGRAGAKSTVVEPEHNTFDTLVGLARIGYEAVTGKKQEAAGLSGDMPIPGASSVEPKGEATTAYEQARDRWRATVERAKTQHPYAYTGGNVVGSLAAPIGVAAAPVRAAGLAGLGARVLRGGAAGAIAGGLSGAGEGTDFADRVVQGGLGAATGAGIGAVAPVVAAPLIAGGQAVGRAVASRARSMFNPALEAERRIAQTVQGAQERAVAQRAAGTEPQTLTRQEMLNAQARGQPAAVLDTAGRGGKRMARSVRNTPGAEEGTEALEGAMQSRFAGQADRTANFISRLTAGRNATSFEQLRERAARANRPAYAGAYAAGDRPIWSPELERLISSPDIEAAVKSAVRSGKSRAVEEGFGGFNPGVTVTPDGRVLMGGAARRGTPTYPNLQFWDYVQRDLADMAKKVEGREPDKFRYLNSLHQQLNTELDRLVPQYQAARVGAWRHFQAEDAYDAGMKYVQNTAIGRKAEELTQQIRDMRPADRVLFMHGFATKLIDDVRKTADNVNVVNRIYNNPAARDRITEALGANRAREIEAFLRVESIMNAGKNAVSGNSSTAEQLLASGMAGTAGSLAYGAATGNWDWSTLLAGAATVGARRVAGRVAGGANARVADEIGRLLSSQDPDAYRRGITMLANNTVMLDRLRAITQALGSKGAAPQGRKLLTDQRRESVN